jgi:site-specific DNA recombinase
MTRLEGIWDQLFPAEQQRIVRLLIEKVIVSPNDLEVLALEPAPTVEIVEEAVA